MDDFKIHCCAHAEHRLLAIGRDKRVFRRMGRIGDQIAVLIRHEIIQKKLCRPFHQRIAAHPQKDGIAGERIVLPYMLTQPGRAHGPDAPDAVRRCGKTPNVGQMMHHPSIAAIMHARGHSAGFHQRLDIIHQRQSAFREMGGLRRPIVHLQIDIGMIIGIPRRRHGFIPLALQVGGQTTGPRTGDEQVTAILKIKRHQRRILSALLDPSQALIRGQVRLGRRRKVQMHTPEPALMFFQVVGQNSRIRLVGGFDKSLADITRIFPTIFGSGGEIQRRCIGVLDREAIAGNRAFAALLGSGQQRLISHTPAVVQTAAQDQHVVPGAAQMRIL
ncbi:MAG: hypothetical protein BWY83_02903 [bacterium ADurb.Bin478]|nr:MAG: hypothetical protein BWY83_02903 [bacterium ADurb.Bin478]